MNKETIVIDGIRYYADRPRSCRGCYFWKNRKAGYSKKTIQDKRRRQEGDLQIRASQHPICEAL